MNFLAKTWILIAVGLGLGTLTARAGTLPRANVSANAKWVVHLDIERFSASQTCQILRRDTEGGGGFQEMLVHYRNLLGVDPLKDLSHVTLYGEETSGNRGVALIAGSMSPKTVVQRLSGYPKYSTKPAGKLTLHKWRDKSGATELNACFYTPRLLVIGSDEPAVLGAMQILNGKQPSLGDQRIPTLPLPPPSEGVFMTAVTRSYAGSSQEPIKALILRSTDSAVIQIAERKGLVDAGIVLSAISPDAAIQIHQILNGLVVSASLVPDADGLAKLAALSEVTRQGQTVSLTLHGPARDMASALATGMLSQ
jgi:hypothetical protein